MSVQGPAPAGPSPALSSRDVVVAQLAALQAEASSGPGGPGTLTAWAFASPGNRSATGPLARFSDLLRDPLYRGLLGHRAATLSPVVERADEARVEVLVMTVDDEAIGYTWVLGRQERAPYAGCWMTEGVLRHPDEEDR